MGRYLLLYHSLEARLQQAAGFVLAEPSKFSLATRDAHAEKPHVAAPLAEFRLVLVAVKRQFETFVPQLGKSLAEHTDRFFRGPFGIGNHKYTERRTGQGPQVPQIRNDLLEIPDTEIVKAE